MECWHRSQYELQTHDTMDNSQEQLKKERAKDEAKSAACNGIKME